ncbi:MAG: orotidine-5'-phosphate decarboxylase [Lautropia sp.]|nr:MAG: orotidine-5'-phosphate decarboxylase [Pseudomonadota bacterium]MBC6959527.1 orotidine-5'-phosphate decarboxylase [Lautropia sp.]MDL1906655.1 orotidine-5'-phosphate decarboxylase [Betaproteobacteria bacterium PRO1]RIK91026.1 MAG: orotidine-5'-phosphate decarboxylase [Burkholderiales bacterium]
MSFVASLQAAWDRADSMLCVGLDPDPSRLPAHLAGRSDAILSFCREIVDATAEFACAFKPQIAYFAAARAEEQLEDLVAHIRHAHPGKPVILDVKRGDIGATAEQYAREAFERYRADAATVNPYMGFDSLEPWLAWRDRGVILLCRTSNPGGSDLQALEVGGERLFERVARLAAGPWNTSGQLGLVVGATYPAELARVRAIAGDLPLLVPGIGAQGGDIEATVRAGGRRMIVNSSRAILYASRAEDFAAAAAAVARATRDALREALAPC